MNICVIQYFLQQINPARTGSSSVYCRKSLTKNPSSKSNAKHAEKREFSNLYLKTKWLWKNAKRGDSDRYEKDFIVSRTKMSDFHAFCLRITNVKSSSILFFLPICRVTSSITDHRISSADRCQCRLTTSHSRSRP